MTFSITTIETRKSESGGAYKLQEKKVSGEHTKYQIFRIREDRSTSLIAWDMGYSEACDRLDWFSNGCPA